jgi:hypothetical protein
VIDVMKDSEACIRNNAFLHLWVISFVTMVSAMTSMLLMLKYGFLSSLSSLL